MTPDALLKLGLSQSLLNLKQRVRCRSPAWGPSPAPAESAVSASWLGSCARRRILTPHYRTKSSRRLKAADARAPGHARSFVDARPAA